MHPPGMILDDVIKPNSAKDDHAHNIMDERNRFKKGGNYLWHFLFLLISLKFRIQGTINQKF